MVLGIRGHPPYSVVGSLHDPHELGDDGPEIFDSVGSFEIADGVLRDSREGIVERPGMLRNQAARVQTAAARLEETVPSVSTETALPEEALEYATEEREREAERDEAIQVYD